MRRPHARTTIATLAGSLVALSVGACTLSGADTKRHKAPTDPYSIPGYGEDGTDPGNPAPRPPDYTNLDSGAFGVGDRPNPSHPSGPGEPTGTDAPDGGTPREGDAGRIPPVPTPTGADAGADSGGADALCPGPLAAGDLAVVELMIQSAAGTADRGEWVEVQSTRDCALDLHGVTFASPRGTQSDRVTVGGALVLPPNGILVVASSTSAALAHDPPRPVLVWEGSPADVLKNDGDTVTVTSAAGVLIDAFTYPALTLQPGRSISFPADCAWSDRATIERWSYASRPYAGTAGADAGALMGTPNAENDDVTCF